MCALYRTYTVTPISCFLLHAASLIRFVPYPQTTQEPKTPKRAAWVRVKDGVHRSKTDFIIVSDTHASHRFRLQKMFSILFAYLYVPHTASCVSVWEGKGLRAHVTIVCAFSYRETCCLHGSHFLDTPAWTLLLVSDTHACVLPMVSDTQTCIVRSPPNISYKTCHCGAVGGATIARQATVQLTGGRKFCKKIQKVMLKFILAKENTAC